MPDNDKTVYKICREQAGYTQEQAAELLHISVRMLCRYEGGEAVPPVDIVDAMGRLYNDNYVVIDHVRRNSAVAAYIIPALDPCSIETAAIRVDNRLRHFLSRGQNGRILEIAEDGVVDKTELADVDLILDDLAELTRVFTELRLALEKRR